MFAPVKLRHKTQNFASRLSDFLGGTGIRSQGNYVDSIYIQPERKQILPVVVGSQCASYRSAQAVISVSFLGRNGLAAHVLGMGNWY